MGHVTPDGQPVLLLTVAGQVWTAILDTGFNGDLELPDNLRPSLNSRFQTRKLSILAAGQTIVEDEYLVDFPFDGGLIEAEATFVPGSEILIGTHFLRDYRLEIDFVARTVLLTRVAPSP